MSVTVDWLTKIISVPQAYLTHMGGDIYELNVNKFRLALKDLEDSETGIVFPDTHRHFTEVTVSGITLGRVVEFINGYTITFEDDQYIVNLVGANHNIGDVTNLNQVSIRVAISAGLQTVVQGSGVTEQDKTDIVNMVWNELAAAHITPGTFGKTIGDMLVNTAINRGINTGRWRIDESARQLIIYSSDGQTPIVTFDLLNAQGVPALTGIRERRPV